MTIAQAQRCSECGRINVYPDVIRYTARVKHDGALREFVVPCLHVLKCRSCGDVLFDSVTDEQIMQGLRSHRGLLSPAEIRASLAQFGWNQKQFAEHLGSREETVSHWLHRGYIQTRALDTAMRNLFELEKIKQKQLAVCVCEVSIPLGELAPWPYSPIYPMAPVQVTQLESDMFSPVSSGEHDTELSYEVARGPPSSRAHFIVYQAAL